MRLGLVEQILSLLELIIPSKLDSVYSPVLPTNASSMSKLGSSALCRPGPRQIVIVIVIAITIVIVIVTEFVTVIAVEIVRQILLSVRPPV